MEPRPPADEIIKGLQTTSDKIRALANANYDRTEISKLLDIRYQHVRNVLLRSGIEGGLRRQVEVEREAVTVDAAPPPREDTSWKVLTDAGFQFLGEWTHDPESLIRLDAKAPTAPGVYAFVVDEVVVYVGLTLSGLKTRLDQYRRGHKGQKTSARINGRILETLLAGKQVKVLVATPEPQEWGASRQHRRWLRGRADSDDPSLLEYQGSRMSEEILFTDLSPPPSSSTALTPLAALADIPEEDIWLAKQKSKRTRRAYKLDVQHFMRTLMIRSYDQLRQVDHRAVIAWERIMREIEKAAPSTVRRRFAALSSLMKHLVRHGHLPKNHVAEVERPNINREERTTLAFSKTQASKLLNTPMPDTIEGLQSRNELQTK